MPVRSKVKLFNTTALIIVLVSLAINGCFYYFNKKNLFCEGLIKDHGEVAYNLYQYNSTKINPARADALRSLEYKESRRVDYYEIDHKSYGPPTQYRSYFDSIGYGVVIGLLWKLTGSLDYSDIQLLQIVLFSLLLFLFFQIALMLLGMRGAIFSSIALLLFFPAFFLNVQVLRDIWPFYSAIIVMYVALRYLLQKSHWLVPVTGGITIALLQFLRPHVFTLILTTSVVLLGYAIVTKEFVRVTKLLLILFTTNILFFWLPFSTYNKMAYDRYIVGATGINLIQGLGEFDNPWGYKLSDGWFVEFMNTKYPQLTDLERDDKAKELFLKAIQEQPLIYIRGVLHRIPRIIFPGLPSFNYQSNTEFYQLYVTKKSLPNVCSLLLQSPSILFDFAFRHIYIGLYLLIAYLGLFLALIRKKFILFFFIFFGVIAAGYSVIFLHTDHRYLIPYFAFFSLFVGYFFDEILKRKNNEETFDCCPHI